MISETCTSHLRSFDILTPKILTISVVWSSSTDSLSGSNTQGSRVHETSMNFFGIETHFVHVSLFVKILEVVLNSKSLVRKGILSWSHIIRALERHLIFLICKTRVNGLSYKRGWPCKSILWLTTREIWPRRLDVLIPWDLRRRNCVSTGWLLV